jgi:hypothetical protein
VQDLQVEDSTSSCSDAVSAQSEDRARFLALQSHCATISIFHHMGIPSNARSGTLSSMAIRTIYIDREVVQGIVVTRLEIVPWRPILHALALQLWPDIVEARRRVAHRSVLAAN